MTFAVFEYNDAIVHPSIQGEARGAGLRGSSIPLALGAKFEISSLGSGVGPREMLKFEMSAAIGPVLATPLQHWFHSIWRFLTFTSDQARVRDLHRPVYEHYVLQCT